MIQQLDQIVERSPKHRFIRFNEEIGKGTYKTVFRGYDEESGCEIAWNVIHLDQLPQQERKRISEELTILNNIKHANIISFINAWINKAKNEVIFITEIIHGGSLKKHLKRIQRPRLKIVKHWCREILKGLEYLHSIQPNPIIHRDIKCDNIFINTHSNQLRIGDLGLAITLKQQDFTKSILGTPEFMAPEIYEEKYGISVDIYAFGMTTLEIATSRRPYEECTTLAQIYKKVLNREKPKQLDLIQNVELKNFILRCLEDQDKRPTASELLNDVFLSTESEADNSHVQLLEEPEENGQVVKQEQKACNKPKIREQLDLDMSIIMELREGDEMLLKITFTELLQNMTALIEQFLIIIETNMKDNPNGINFEQVQQQCISSSKLVMQFGCVQKMQWIKQIDNHKDILKEQFNECLERYHQREQQVHSELSLDELEEIEQQLLVQFQSQRRLMKHQ